MINESSDAIVNAANENLQLGAGVAGAIKRAGGPIVQTMCNKLLHTQGRTPTGGAHAVTSAGEIQNVRFVIHAVGPIYRNYNEETNMDLMQSVVINILETAKNWNMESVSIPAISSGIFGFPK